MDIDWGLVGEVAGAGYGLTFFVLIVLAVCAWLAGIILPKIERSDDEGDKAKKR